MSGAFLADQEARLLAQLASAEAALSALDAALSPYLLIPAASLSRSLPQPGARAALHAAAAHAALAASALQLAATGVAAAELPAFKTEAARAKRHVEKAAAATAPPRSMVVDTQASKRFVAAALGKKQRQRDAGVEEAVTKKAARVIIPAAAEADAFLGELG